MATSWAELQATLNLDTRGFEAGAARATAQAGGLQSRLGGINATASRMRGAMSSVSAAMGGVAGQAGATGAAVSNMINAFQAGPIVAAAAGITAALTSYFAVWNKQLDDARARLDEYISTNKQIRAILTALDIVPDESAQARAWIARMERAEDEAALLRRLSNARVEAADIPPTSENPADLQRLRSLQEEIKLLEAAANRVEAVTEKRARDTESARAQASAAAQEQAAEVKDLRRQQELVGKDALEQAKLRRKYAKEDVANAGTLIERERALLELKKAESDVFLESLPDGKNPMEDKERKRTPPEFERLVQMGANLRSAPAAGALQNVANLQLSESRKQTALLNDIAKGQGRF